MKKVIYITFLLLSLNSFSQYITVETKLEAEKISEVVNESSGQKTIIDYGAVMYPTAEAALLGRESAHTAILAMLKEWDTAMLPGYGFFFIEVSSVMHGLRWNINSLGQSNRGVNLITDLPIDMFILTNHEQEVRGFTAWYVGDKITKECAVVRLGGSKLNLGGEFENWYLKTRANHFRKGRTNGIALNLDFDVIGDRTHAFRYDPTGKKLNDNFIDNYGVTAVLVDFDNEIEDNFSHLHFSGFKGLWKYVNTGVKITRREGSRQSLNTLEIDAKIWGARQFVNIKGINFSSIKIMGQEQKMLDVGEKLDLGTIQAGHSLLDFWVYDVGGQRSVDVKGTFELNGVSNTVSYIRSNRPRITNLNLNKVTFLNNDWFLTQERIDKLWSSEFDIKKHEKELKENRVLIANLIKRIENLEK